MDETAYKITHAANFSNRIAIWLQNPSGYRNFLRITQILQFLYHFGHQEYAQVFFNILKDIWAPRGSGLDPRDDN